MDLASLEHEMDKWLSARDWAHWLSRDTARRMAQAAMLILDSEQASQDTYKEEHGEISDAP